MGAETEQSEVFAFLASAAAWPEGSEPIERHDTHGAAVFLSGDVALKVKRAVKLAYLDFSTLALREATLRRELALNRPQAPSLYRDVVAITREADGRLAVGGDGQVVEWALRMRRFPQEALLLSIVERGAMAEALATALAERIADYHAAAARPEGARERHGDAVAALIKGLRSSGDERIVARAHDLEPLFAAALSRTAALRARRRDAGSVRRCHGDLHLGNIVVLDGVPTLFDALEFDEALATIDTLYDLAFVLMDLDRHGAGRFAVMELNRYLAKTRESLDGGGWALLALFLAARAAVRAVVAVDRLKGRGEPLDAALPTLDLAARYLALPDGSASAAALFSSP